jgi:hypothetical protein
MTCPVRQAEEEGMDWALQYMRTSVHAESWWEILEERDHLEEKFRGYYSDRP